MTQIWTVIKRFFRWPYSVYTLILILGAVEFITQLEVFGILTVTLGVWAFLIEYNKP